MNTDCEYVYKKNQHFEESEMNSSLITFSLALSHTHTGTWRAHHFTQTQMLGEIDANKQRK